jgi:hypothetical protein
MQIYRKYSNSLLLLINVKIKFLPKTKLRQHFKKFKTLSIKKKAGTLSKARLPVTIFLPLKRK